MYTSGPVITSTTDGREYAAGQMTWDTTAGFGVTQKYFSATSSTMFAGLFVGRTHTTDNYTIAQSLDQITSPTIANVIGLLGYFSYGQSVVPAIGTPYIDMPLFPAGIILNICNISPGMAQAWCGSALPTTDAIFIYAGATINSDTLGNKVITGSIVSQTWVTANTTMVDDLLAAPTTVACAGFITKNPEYNGQVFAYGTLVPVSFNLYGR